jgi:hypothetical protein
MAENKTMISFVTGYNLRRFNYYVKQTSPARRHFENSELVFFSKDVTLAFREVEHEALSVK